MFIASDIVDLLAPNCWVSMEFGACWRGGDACSAIFRPGLGRDRAVSGFADVVRGGLAVLTTCSPPPLGMLLVLRRFDVGSGMGRGWHSMPERTHMVHGLVASHFRNN